MADIAFEEVAALAEQLTPKEQQALVERLQAKRGDVVQPSFKPRTLDLLVFDVGEWPEELTLRREDEYGEDER